LTKGDVDAIKGLIGGQVTMKEGKALLNENQEVSKLSSAKLFSKEDSYAGRCRGKKT
jgi:hypothetical protein